VIIEELRAAAEIEHVVEHTLQQAVEGWLAECKGERGLKRSTIAGYEDMFEGLFRDLGADTPLRSLADGRLRGYFADLIIWGALGPSACCSRSRFVPIFLRSYEAVAYSRRCPTA
jgi:hypothetical protein